MLRLHPLALYDLSSGTTHASFEALSFESAVALAMDATLAEAPCYSTAGDASVCYAQMMRLAYLNQQSDGGAIELRRGKKCLTLARRSWKAIFVHSGVLG